MELTIGQIAQQCGLPTSAIRYYENVGLLPAAERINGRRRYDASILQRLGLIQIARHAGFRIHELQVLFGAFSTDTPASDRWRALAIDKVAEMEDLIERTQTIKTWLMDNLAACQCVQVGDCATVTIDEAGQAHLQTRPNPI